MTYLLENADILTGESLRKGAVAIDGEKIGGIWYYDDLGAVPEFPEAEKIDLEGKTLMAGMIDSHVHFREPGMTWKGDLYTESRAALMGGVTSYIDMPNTAPPTTSRKALEDKLSAAKGRSWSNYGFHLGATSDNIKELAEADRSSFGAVKVFLASSTGDMKLDDENQISKILEIHDKAIFVHSEDQDMIDASLQEAKMKFGENIPMRMHSKIRGEAECVKATSKILALAVKEKARVHICHVSTAEEAHMIARAKERWGGITAETSANYLWFSEDDYGSMGGKIKCNPSIKKPSDREALRKALAEGVIDTVGSDHAPHLIEEKAKPYLQCPSGIPSVQEELPVLLTMALRHGIPLRRIARAVSERPAEILGIERRGFIRKGYAADLVAVDLKTPFISGKPEYKCGWGPYEGRTLVGKINMVFLNGEKAVENGMTVSSKPEGKPLIFN